MRGLGIAGALLFTAGAVVGGLLTAMLANEYEETRKPRRRIDEGDLVQWELNNKFMFPKPKLVARIEDDPQFGPYVFVEGSDTGIPVEQIVKLSSNGEVGSV